MSRELPEWQAYDPASSPLPDIRGSGGTPKAGVVLVLLAAPGVREDGWSARAAAALASGMAGAGRRVFLADVDLAHPGLHHVLGVSNDEGVSDAFVYGASIQRVARPVDDGRYFFAPAGTPVGDARAVASSRRWQPVLDGFRTARADVVLLVPTDQEGTDLLLERATDVVVLATRGDGAASAASAAGAADRVRAVLGPSEGGVSVEDGARAGSPSPRMDDVPPLPSSAGKVPRSAAARGPASRRAAKPRSRTTPLLVLLLVVLVAAAVGWWLGFLEVPGLPSRGDAGAVAPPAVSMQAMEAAPNRRNPHSA